MDDIELVVNVPEGMTREEIKKTPELVDFMLDECVTAVTRMKLHKRLEELCKLAIEALEQTRWIPVSEKLPKPFTYVNITCRSLVDDRENWVVETLYLPIPKEFNKHGYSDWGNIPMINLGDAEVIAWVERIIPQPYKAESEDKE